MATINCYTCDLAILTYEPGQPVPTYVIVAPGAPVPPGNHLVHHCPQQVPYVAQKRPQDVLDWTDEQERAAVQATLFDWELLPDDEIFCMSWFAPGAGRSEVGSAPLTVQVRRKGIDLKYAQQGIDFDEATLLAAEAIALLEQLGIPHDDPAAADASGWDRLQTDLEAETAAAVAAEEARERQAKAAAQAAAVWQQAFEEARGEAEHAAAHAVEHPDDEQLRQIAAYTQSQVQVMQAYADQSAATASALTSSEG